MITVVGMDGSPLGPLAEAALAAATLVVGGRRHLAALPVPAGPAAVAGVRTVVLGELAPALEVLAAHDGDAVVLASGDPGFFGIVRALRERGLAAVVLPAVSSVALAFARAGLPWDDAAVVSAHGRDLRPAVNVCRASATARTSALVSTASRLSNSSSLSAQPTAPAPPAPPGGA